MTSTSSQYPEDTDWDTDDDDDAQIGTERSRKAIPGHTGVPDSTSPTTTAQIRYPQQGGTADTGAQYLGTAPEQPDQPA